MGNTPYLIETNTTVQQGQEQAWNQGLYQIGSDLWSFIPTANQVTSDVTLNAYESAGLAGQSWAQQSTGPLITSYGGTGVGLLIDHAAGKMYAAFFDPNTLELCLTNFTFADTTWAATIAGGPVVLLGSFIVPNPLLQRTSTGDSFLCYQDNLDTFVVKYSGGWSAPIMIAGESIRSAVIDASNILHIMTFLAPNKFRHRTFNGTTLSAPSTAYTSPGGPNSAGPASYDATNDELIFPIIDAVGLGQDLALLRGSPSAAPVWTYDAAANTGAVDFIRYPKYLKIQNQDYVLVMNEVGSGTPHLDIVYYKKTGATWGTQKVFWDELANPGVPPQTIIDNFSLWSIGLLSDGVTIGGTLGLLPAGANVQCAEQYAIVGAVAAAPAPPQNNPGPAGRRPLILTPNQFDFCLHRENRLYCAIDIARLTCANIPACFSVDEREWGGAS